MYTPVNPSFTIYKWGLRGSKLHRRVFVMKSSVFNTTAWLPGPVGLENVIDTMMNCRETVYGRHTTFETRPSALMSRT